MKLRSLINISGKSERSQNAVKNIIISLIVKGVSVLSTMLIVPLTIGYLNPTQYGIWVSIYSIIAWVGFMDLGLGNGFRNKFAEAKANNDILLGQQFVSTTYFALTIVAISLLTVGLTINAFVDWAAMLGVSDSYRGILQITFGIVLFFFCMNLVVSLISSLLNADQQPGLSSALSALGQLISLLVIFILTRVSDGSLINLALFFSGIPCIVFLISSFIIFRFTRYKKYSPKRRCIRIELIKDVLSLGGRFFVIYICMILIFQIVNIVISRELGPEYVTEYDIANKYFNMLYMVMLIILTPFWSAFTDAYTKKELDWMVNIMRKLEITWLTGCVIGCAMLIFSPVFYRIWVGNRVCVSFMLSCSMYISVCCQMLCAVYMYMINGIGAIRLQLVIYIILAVIAWPIFLLSCRLFGLPGVVIMPALAYSVQAIFGKIQLNKILSNKAAGIWLQ